MIRQSDTIVELAAALVAAQAEMPNAPKETKGQVGSQIRFYTDLPTVTDLIRPILAKHKLAFLQFPSGGSNGAVTVTTRLIHTSGQWIEDDLSMPTGGNGAQGVGSALTYAKRYSLMSVLGVAADDDDGAAASQQQRPKPAPKQKAPDSPSEALTKRAMAMFGEAGIKERADRLAFTSQAARRDVTSWSEVTGAEAADVIAALKDLNTGAITIVYDETGRLTLRAAG